MQRHLKPGWDFGSRVRSIAGVIALACFAVGCEKHSPPSKPPASPADAIGFLQDRVRAEPNFESFTNLGIAYSQAGRHVEALGAFERALAIDPRSAVAYNNVCSEKAEVHEWPAAIQNCKKALEISPGFAQAKNNLSRAESGLAAERTQIIDLQRAIAGGKDVDRNRIELGLAYYRRGDLDEAVATWKKVPEGSAQYATAQNDLGSVYIVRKKFADAEKALARALKLEPGNALFKNNLAWLRSEMKRK